MKPLWQQLPQNVMVWENCGRMLCFPSPTVNERALYHSLIMRQTLSGSARLPVYEGCMCRLCVSNVTEKWEEVCAECSRASSPFETKGDFCLSAGTMWGYEAIHGAWNVCHVFWNCAFFCKYRPLWAGQSCSSLFGSQGHMGVQLKPQ